MSSHKRGSGVAGLGAVIIALGMAGPTWAHDHHKVKIRIVQYGGAPVTAQITGGAAGPVVIISGSAAPVTLGAAPVTLGAAPTTTSAAPTTTSAASYILVPAPTAGATSSGGAAAPNAGSNGKVKVTKGSAEIEVDRSLLVGVLNQASGSQAAPDSGQAAAGSTPTTYVLVAAPQQGQASPTQQVTLQASPPQQAVYVQAAAATTTQPSQSAAGTTIIVIGGRRFCCRP